MGWGLFDLVEPFDLKGLGGAIKKGSYHRSQYTSNLSRGLPGREPWFLKTPTSVKSQMFSRQLGVKDLGGWMEI